MKKEQSPYKAHKTECKQLIDDLMGNRMVNGRFSELERSSREALKEVFKDPKLGPDAFNYLKGLM